MIQPLDYYNNMRKPTYGIDIEINYNGVVPNGESKFFDHPFVPILKSPSIGDNKFLSLNYFQVSPKEKYFMNKIIHGFSVN